MLLSTLAILLAGLLVGFVLVRKGMRQEQLNPEPQLNLPSSLP